VTAKQVDHLVKMAEQIALNLGAGQDDAGAQRTAEHMRRFWTPAMCRQLVLFWRAGGEVSAVVAAALQQLDEQQQRGAS
jgi:formate dehydrogenase subunit delta